MLGKKQSSCVGFNPFSKFTKEKPSISTKIINKLKSLFQVNLNPSSCIQRELISQQTIYVPVNSEIVGAQIIEQDSIKICHSQSSQRQRRNKITSFDDHLKEQQSQKEQQSEISSKVQQKEEKELRKLNTFKKSFDPVLPEDIEDSERKEKKVTHPRRKLSSQQYKKRKLDEKKKSVGIKFINKKHVYDSINESRIQEVQEQISDDSLKNNSLLVGGLKEEPQVKEITIVQLNDTKPKQHDPPMLTINEIIEHQSKGLKKSQSMINLNEQEVKSFSCSPKKIENSQSRKQSDVINKINEPKKSEPQKDEVIQQKEEKKQDEKQTESQVQPQQSVIDFLVQGPAKQEKPQTSQLNLINKVTIDEKKPFEQQEKNIINFSDTPLFGLAKSSEGGQILANKINVQSSLFASYDSKELNQQQSSHQSSGQNLQQNQFTFQNKLNVNEIQQQPSISESSSSNVNNKKDSIDQQPKIEENKQSFSLFNNISGNQIDQLNTNDQFPHKKQLFFQNLGNVVQSTQGEQKGDSKQDQTDEITQIQKKPEEQKSGLLFQDLNFQIPNVKNQTEKNSVTTTQKEPEQPTQPFLSLFNLNQNDKNNKEKPSTGLFNDLFIKQTDKDKPKQEANGEEKPQFLGNILSKQINPIQENKDVTNPPLSAPSLFGGDNILILGNKNNTIDTPTNQDCKQQQQQINSAKLDIQTPVPNSIGLNCQWKSSSDDHKNNQFNITSEPKQQLKQSPFAFLQEQRLSDNSKSENLSSDPIKKLAETPVKPIENPFLQQSPKIDQEQINSYFSNQSQQSRNHQDEHNKIQTSQFKIDDLFKQQNNGPSMFTQPSYPQQQPQQQLQPQPLPQPVQPSLFFPNSIPQQNQQNSFFQLTNNNNMMNTNMMSNNIMNSNNMMNNMMSNNHMMNNNGMNYEMEFPEAPQGPPQLLLAQQQSQQQTSFSSYLQPQLGALGFPSQMQQQISGPFPAASLFQNKNQSTDIGNNLFYPSNHTNGLFSHDQQKPQSLNSSFTSKNGQKNKKQRV
ncbi:unnamed protein product [Paramecium octaurelia]|uniref:Uncharacterized protein n=1 Tax=Paramecium octaurelia TaxID=43137 RepID=A0A8S1VVK5_PAROT|nr:unnamed protein product [Paramecium octaurelia]